MNYRRFYAILFFLLFSIFSGCSQDKGDLFELIKDAETMAKYNDKAAKEKFQKAITAVYNTSDFNSNASYGTPEHLFNALYRAKLEDDIRGHLILDIIKEIIQQKSLSLDRKGADLIRVFNGLVQVKMQQQKKYDILTRAVSMLETDKIFGQFEYGKYKNHVIVRIKKQTIINDYKTAIEEDNIEQYEKLLTHYPKNPANKYIEARIGYLKTIEGPSDFLVILLPIGGDLGTCLKWRGRNVISEEIKETIIQFIKSVGFNAHFSFGKIAPNTNQYQASLEITLNGSALSKQYVPRSAFPGSIGSTSYTGASVAGSLAIDKGGSTSLMKFSGHFSPPNTTVGIKSNKCYAPFYGALSNSDFVETLFRLFNDVFGEKSLMHCFFNGTHPKTLKNIIISSSDKNILIDALGFLSEDESYYAEGKFCRKMAVEALGTLTKDPIVLPDFKENRTPEKWNSYWKANRN